jgi:hypothetical protein
MKKRRVTAILTACALFALNCQAEEIKPGREIANGSTKYFLGADGNILYFKLDAKQVFKVLITILGSSQKQAMGLSNGKILSESFNLDNDTFKMKRQVALADGAVVVDLTVDIDKSGKTDFTAQLNYKKDFTWSANHKRLANMIIMETAEPVEFKAITYQDETLNGKAEGKVDRYYLKEVTMTSVVGPITIKAENDSTFIRLSSPAALGANFQGVYIQPGLCSPKNKGGSVHFEQGDTEVFKFSVTSAGDNKPKDNK